MASHEPGTCCFVGFKHEGQPKGTMRKVGEYDAYFATPKQASSKAILLVPDFMGYELVNTKLVADQFAANGFTTIIPDIWEGDNVPLNWTPTGDFNLGQWFGRHPAEKVETICQTAMKVLKEEYGAEKIGAAGFCLGAKFVCRLLAEGKGIDVGYGAHPSVTTAEEIRGVKGPLMIAAAENDQMFPVDKRQETEGILKESGHPFAMTVYNHVEHGFGLRADLSNPYHKFVSEASFLQAVNWFEYFLKA